MSYFAVHVIRVGKSDIQPNRKIPDGVLTPAEIAKLLAKGAIKEYQGPVAAPVTTTNQETTDPSAWAYTDDELRDKDVEALNMMIQDHVRKHGLIAVEPMDTIEEAMVWLTKDRR